jgi:hypothetical protein
MSHILLQIRDRLDHMLHVGSFAGGLEDGPMLQLTCVGADLLPPQRVDAYVQLRRREVAALIGVLADWLAPDEDWPSIIDRIAGGAPHGYSDAD